VSATIWHDVECGAYAADLGLWEELAEQADGPVLDLGCGTGRVALHLARRGHRVIGVDREPELIAALEARGDGLALQGVAADARDFRLPGDVALARAPMQLLQLLPDSRARLACLDRVIEYLRPGGRIAAAIVEGMPEPDGSPPPLPDVREVDGWVYSSLPLDVVVGAEDLLIRRLRQTVSPAGELAEERNEVRIHTFPADRLEAEGEVLGLSVMERREIAPTDLHVGSVVVVFERAA
jgi:SAM-dependent methyltransferase